jgi:hypothetical protein
MILFFSKKIPANNGLNEVALGDLSSKKTIPSYILDLTGKNSVKIRGWKQDADQVISV